MKAAAEAAEGEAGPSWGIKHAAQPWSCRVFYLQDLLFPGNGMLSGTMLIHKGQ